MQKNIINIKSEELAIIKGYYIDNNGIVKKGNKIRKPSINSMGYYQFGIRFKRKIYTCAFHRLMAFQKFGYKLYEDNIEVRHINNIKIDNSYENIILGTHKENMNDLPREMILRNAKIASDARRKLRNI